VDTDTHDDLFRLRNFIDDEALNGRHQLPPEPKLAEAINVSRGRLRTLLKRCEEDGLIWRHVGKGTFIGEREFSAAAPDWARDISLRDIMDARRLLEPVVARQAAISARPADVAAMETCIAEMETASSLAQWKRFDERLHRLIATATHNSMVLALYDTLRVQGRDVLDRRLSAVFGTDKAPNHTDAEHRMVVASIRAADPGAAEQAMRNHLNSVQEQLFEMD